MAKLFVCSNTFAKAVLIAAVLSIISIQISADKSMPDDRFATMDGNGDGNGDKIRIHYKNYGKGKDAIVFIHGWSCDLSFWDANIPAFVGRGPPDRNRPARPWRERQTADRLFDGSLCWSRQYGA
ncbi:MAG: alpha/beta hydrolase [Acidobacteria bacterium]|nr:alpha/beta hydrolase [Acidobacteriota bacterium]